MIVLYLVRHGETVYNVERRVQGWSDSLLTEKGREQARETGKKLSDIRFSYVYAGDLIRQKDTAEEILGENKQWGVLPVEIDARFREVGFGGFEGVPEEELLRAMAKIRNREAVPFPQLAQELSKQEISDLVKQADDTGMAEGGAEAFKRFHDGLLDVARKSGNSMQDEEINILVVSSAAVMGMLSEMLDVKNCRREIVKNGEVIVLKCEEGEFIHVGISM